MKELKPNITLLHQRGSVGDDIWTRFTTSEKLAEMELNEVAQEAEKLHKGWGQQIIASAVELTQNAAIRKRMADFSKNPDYKAALELATPSGTSTPSTPAEK
jgi:translocation protein SEC66